GGVGTGDVGGRVGFGVTESLRLGEDVTVRPALLGHLREDEVRGPIHDPHHGGDPFPGERFRKRPGDRDSPDHRRLEQERHAVRLSALEQRRPLGGHQLLVGGHDRLSGVQGAQDEGAGRFHPTHQLDDQPDVGVGDHLLGAIGGRARRQRALLVQVPDRDLDQLQVEARLRRDHVAFGEKLVSEAAAVDAATEDSDTYAHGRKTLVLRHSAPEPAPGTLEVSTRSRSSGDRALVSGTRCAGSSPAGSAVMISELCSGGGTTPHTPRASAYWRVTRDARVRAPEPYEGRVSFRSVDLPPTTYHPTTPYLRQI